VAKLKNGSAFIEAENVYESSDISADLKKVTTTKSISPLGEIWVGPQTLITLQSGVKKAITWANKNIEVQMEFTKEIGRFRTMDKQTYSFYKKYISEFSNEGKLIFNGYSDGTFQLDFEVDGSPFRIKISSVEALESFLSLLQGKSANKDVDDIFN
jgi:hypothetical protein